MTYYLAANDRTLVILRFDGLRPVLTLRLKSHPLSKGLTKAQAAVALMALLGDRTEKQPGRLSTLDRALKADARLSGLLFNEPPQEFPIVHARLFSLDSTNVETWLRKVFGSYRDCLPPIVSSLQQELENYTGLRWITNKEIPEDLIYQLQLAKETHIGIGDVVADRQERQRRQGAL